MDYRRFLNRLIDRAQGRMENSEAFLVKNKELQIGVYKGEITKYSIAESGGLSLRGSYEGKMGYSYTEKIDDSSIDTLVHDAIENGRYVEGSEDEVIFSGSESYEDIDHYNEALNRVENSEKLIFTETREGGLFPR